MGVIDRGMDWTKAEPGYIPPAIDTKTPNVARIYDYWLGGKDNFEADRVAAELGAVARKNA